MRKWITLVLVLGLVAGLNVAPVEAKKRKKKVALESVDSTLFMRMEECGAGFLSTSDAEDVDCGAETAMLGVELPYAAADGIPFVLDATRPITGTITMRNFNQAAGAGNIDLQLIVAGSSGGEDVEIGVFETTYLSLPAMAETIEYEIQPAEDLDKKAFDTLTFTVVCGGVIIGVSCVVEHDEPPSQIVVPTWAPKG
ncbi:MAG TPA: hypothetical protein VJ927_09200 [Actinomycetota bacterium]|nr:hypothetical protein [Actinomycetota bacterium]